MKNLFNILIAFAFAFLLISCEKEIDNPETGETIYIATISADSTAGEDPVFESTVWQFLNQNLNVDYDTINFDTLDINNHAEIIIAADSIKTLFERATITCNFTDIDISSPTVTYEIINNVITYNLAYSTKFAENNYVPVTYTYTLQLTPAKPKE